QTPWRAQATASGLASCPTSKGAEQCSLPSGPKPWRRTLAPFGTSAVEPIHAIVKAQRSRVIAVGKVTNSGPRSSTRAPSRTKGAQWPSASAISTRTVGQRRVDDRVAESGVEAQRARQAL